MLPTGGAAYAELHARVVELISPAVANPSAVETVVQDVVDDLRAGSDPELPPRGPDERQVLEAVADAARRLANGEIDVDEAAHVALKNLDNLGLDLVPQPEQAEPALDVQAPGRGAAEIEQWPVELKDRDVEIDL